jgi:hypothetical protein
MEDFDVLIMGYPINICYRIHDPSYVEWSLVNKIGAAEEIELLNILLRVHYGEFIEAAIREHHFYESYAKSAGWRPIAAIEKEVYDEIVDFPKSPMSKNKV